MSDGIEEVLMKTSEVIADRLIDAATRNAAKLLGLNIQGFDETAHRAVTLACAHQALMEAYCRAIAFTLRDLPKDEQEQAIIEKGTLFAMGLRIFANTPDKPTGAPTVN